MNDNDENKIDSPNVSNGESKRPVIASSTSHRPPVTRKDFYTQATGRPMPRKVEETPPSEKKPIISTTRPNVSYQKQPDTGKKVVFDAESDLNSKAKSIPVVSNVDSLSGNVQVRNLNKTETRKTNTSSSFIDVEKEKAAKKKEDEIKREKQINIISIICFVLAAILFVVSFVYLFIGRNKKTVAGIAENETPKAVSIEYQFKCPLSLQKHYDVEFPDGIQEKYKDLYAQNKNFVGWLSVPNTCIDQAVYQAGESYYLKHDNFGEYTKYGVPFLDEYCGVQNLSRNSTIYGHNFDNKLIFDELHNYETLDFYKKSPVITFNTLYKDYKWKVFAAFRSNGNAEGDNGYLFYYVAADMNDNSFMLFYNQVMERSYLKTQSAVQVIPTDKILTLSTCTYFFDRNGSLENARFVVMARLVRDGEDENVDTSSVTATKDVRYPQLYYDVFGGQNPYANSYRWYPETD